MFSGIRLGDAYLNLYDLYQLKLDAELVTLSGCATGMNVVTPGDELLGLIRGLLYAGAHSLLLTLWDVHDQSTADFMAHFLSALPGRGWQTLRPSRRDDRITRTLPAPLPLGSIYAYWQDFPRLTPGNFFRYPLYFLSRWPPL